jgi:hypothetical protein
VTSGPGTDSGLSVPFLVDPDHEDVDRHIEKRRFFWLDLQGLVIRHLFPAQALDVGTGY